jgi:glycosyltransferase involved in cell wall biosynthesis
VVVGPELAAGYRRSARLHVAYVSLLREEDVLARQDDERAYDGGELRMLSVGRLDPEKNPLLLADVLARAVRRDARWRLDVCGDGSLRAALARRLHDLGVSDRALLHGYVPIDDGLWKLYRRSHALVHISLTEGVPQVLLEAFAARLPVVATSVGGVPEIVRGCGLLVPPADAGAAVGALERLVSNVQLRNELVDKASGRAREHTLDAECARLAAFLAPQPETAGASADLSTNC